MSTIPLKIKTTPIIQDTLDYLKKQFIKRGNKNFEFKSKTISHSIHYDPRAVAKILAILEKEGLVAMENKDRCKVHLWTTTFKEIRKELE